MKKIYNQHQLKAEQKRLKVRQEELESIIRDQWTGLKESFRPGHTAAAPVNGKKGILKQTFEYGMNLLTTQLAQKAGEKITRLFKK